MISPHDEALLSWFFGEGQCAFERSTMGPMLAHAELFGHVGELVYRERSESYELAASRLRRPAAPWGSVSDGAIVYSGYEVSARPTAELRSASGYTPNLLDLERHAEVSRVLAALERRSLLAVAALEAYYGDLGAEAARTPKPGRLGSLFHLTSAGARLLEDSAAEARTKGQPVAGSLSRRMANEVGRAKKPERVRVALLRCERQAIELRRAACEAWCAARVQQR